MGIAQVFRQHTWALMLCNILIPQVLWSKKARSNVWVLFAVSMAIIGLIGCAVSFALPRGADPLERDVVEGVAVITDVGHDLGRQDPVERLGEIGLDRASVWPEPLRRSVGVGEFGRGEGLRRGTGEDEGARGVNGAGVGQLQCGLRAAHQLGVEGREGPLGPGMKAVEAGGVVGEIPGDKDERQDDDDRPFQ